ncbi:MAG: OmpA family protein [Myxococcales bacterium]|nr:OmpA family protein [Myxococcales bacterium]MCB9718206.1 OmpA family protein [Myxococcales bacterium]
MSRRAKLLAVRLAVALPFSGPAAAHAAPSGGDGEASPNEGVAKGPKLDLGGLKGKAKAKAKAKVGGEDDAALSKRKDRPWVQRWAPERNMLELGAYGGLMLPARDLELFEPRPNRPRQGFLPLATVAPEVGVRLGYFPLRFLGVEAEGSYLPTSTLKDGYPVSMFAVRGHLIGQLPFASIAPFALFGAGALGMRSNPAVVLGQDVDPAFHLGIGSKLFINRRIVARLDLRDVISPRRGVSGGATNSIEVLLGLSITLGRERDVDRQPEPEPEPTKPDDQDGDGFIDEEDACPTEAGVAPDGCPAASDRDGDGFVDEEDTCPDEAGVEPDGCPDRDADGDGILVPDDQCPQEPESYNGFEDDDGCADEVPDEIQRFSGRLEGINFELSKANLTKDSRPMLDEAVAVLVKYPHIRIEVSGHTDNSGKREVNMRLSQKRADAVKQYLVEHGVDESRIITRGAGPDEPIDSNASADGRANNRRIEFRILD